MHWKGTTLRLCRAEDIAMGMTAHIVFAEIDPANPATTSQRHERVIRDEIGFDGLIMSDDISMRRLSGAIGDRAAAVNCSGLRYCAALQW